MLLIILKESLVQSFSTILLLTLILIPIMIFLEYARHYLLLEKISPYLNWLTRWLSLPPAAAFPLLIGLLIGVFYGAAVIIEYSRQGLLNKRELVLIGIFLAINHSIIEDNLLFAALGANLGVLFVIRFVMAFLITRGVALLMERYREKKELVAGSVKEGKMI